MDEVFVDEITVCFLGLWKSWGSHGLGSVRSYDVSLVAYEIDDTSIRKYCIRHMHIA